MMKNDNKKEHQLYFAGGCFWGTAHFFKQIKGVKAVRVGYANSNSPHPSYELVRTGTTGAAETVQVVFDENEVSIPFLIDLFFKTIDPTSLNKQGEDEGTQYRTGIYYVEEADAEIIASTVNRLAENYSSPLQLEILPLENFYLAETYHQDYLEKHPTGYCHIDPSLFEMAKAAREER